MESIHSYLNVNRKDPRKSFGISRMEDIYAKRQGQPDQAHRHQYYTILLIKQAKGQHFVDFQAYPLSNQQVYFISPGQVHQIIEEQVSIGFSMVFSSHFLVENNIPLHFIEDLNLFNDYGQAPPLLLSTMQEQRLSHYCEEMIQYFQGNDSFKIQAIGALVQLFLIQCHQLFQAPVDHSQQIEAGHSILKNFKALVEQHYTSWHATAHYAQQLSISPDHLNRTIKSLINLTAKEYIQSRITIAAKRLLYFSNLSAKQIAYQLGFSAPANFSAFFKKCTGQSPSEFRKEWKRLG